MNNKDFKRYMYSEFGRTCIKICSAEQDADGNIKYFENSEWKKISDLLFEILEELFCECAQFQRERGTQINFLRWALLKLNSAKREMEARK